MAYTDYIQSVWDIIIYLLLLSQIRTEQPLCSLLRKCNPDTTHKHGISVGTHFN